MRINSPTSIWTRLPERTSGLSVPRAGASPSILTIRSKSELKKRQKQRALEEKKKEKAAAAPSKPKPEKTASAEEDESQLTPNVRPIDPQGTCFPSQLIIHLVVAIFRNPVRQSPEATAEQGTQPLPAQIQGYHRSERVSAAI